MNITPKANEELKKILTNEKDMIGIRIFSQHGCCGPAIHMSLIGEPFDDDKEISIDSLKFFIDKSAEELIEGVTIDYGQQGFKLDGLKRSGSCC